MIQPSQQQIDYWSNTSREIGLNLAFNAGYSIRLEELQPTIMMMLEQAALKGAELQLKKLQDAGLLREPLGEEFAKSNEGPDAKTTILYAPNLEEAYGTSLDTSIDTAIRKENYDTR